MNFHNRTGRHLLCIFQQLLLSGYLLTQSSLSFASTAAFPSLLEVRDHKVNLQQQKAEYEQGKTIFGTDSQPPNSYELNTYNWSSMKVSAELALLTGDKKSFSDLLGALKTAEGIYDDVKATSIVRFYRYLIQADVQNVDMSDFGKWFDIASKTMRSQDFADAKSSLLFYEQDLKGLHKHLEALSALSDAADEYAYAAWLLSRLDETDENLERAIAAITRARNASGIPDGTSTLMSVYHVETLVRQANRVNLGKLTGKARTDALAAVKEIGKTVAESRKSTDLLEYPLLFGYVYEVTARYYDLLVQIAQPVAKPTFQQRKERAQAIADQYR